MAKKIVHQCGKCGKTRLGTLVEEVGSTLQMWICDKCSHEQKIRD